MKCCYSYISLYFALTYIFLCHLPPLLFRSESCCISFIVVEIKHSVSTWFRVSVCHLMNMSILPHFILMPFLSFWSQTNPTTGLSFLSSASLTEFSNGNLADKTANILNCTDFEVRVFGLFIISNSYVTQNTIYIKQMQLSLHEPAHTVPLMTLYNNFVLP